MPIAVKWRCNFKDKKMSTFNLESDVKNSLHRLLSLPIIHSGKSTLCVAACGGCTSLHHNN